MRGLSTSALRRAWADPSGGCYKGPLAVFTLYGGARISVRPSLIPVLKIFNALLIKHNYPCTPPDCGAMNCRAITGGTGLSLHALAIAWDLEWLLNPYQLNDGSIITNMPPGLIRDIEALYTNNGKPLIRCGINYTGKHVDPMHFEMCCTPADLATGIKGFTPVIVVDPELWLPFGSGETDASIDARGGLGTEVTEVQMILTRLSKLYDAPRLDPRGIDGEHRGYSETAVTWYKRRWRAEQRKRGWDVWPDDTPYVGPKVIQTLRYENKYALAA